MKSAHDKIPMSDVTLRDWFAVQLVSGMFIQLPYNEGKRTLEDLNPKTIWQLADLLLQARGDRNEHHVNAATDMYLALKGLTNLLNEQKTFIENEDFDGLKQRYDELWPKVNNALMKAEGRDV